MQTSWRFCPDEASEGGFSCEGCAAPGCRGWWRRGFLHTAGCSPCRLRQPELPGEQLCSETATSSRHRHPEKPPGPRGWRSRVSAHHGQAAAFLASAGRGLGDTGKRGTVCPIFTAHVHGPPPPSRCPPFLRDSWPDTQNGCPSPSPTHSAGSVWVLLESACSELLLPGPADSPAFVIDRVFQNLPAWKLARLALLPLLPPRVPAPEFLGRQFLLWTHGFLAHSRGRPAEELMVNACLVLLPLQNCALS